MLRRAAAILLAMLMLLPVVARADTAAVQTTWRLLDYVAVDYSGAVHNGRVISEAEYAEMLEFTDSAAAKIATLPPNGARAQLLANAKRLKAAVVAKESPQEVARQARSVAAALLNAYPVPLAPARNPDLARGATLYGQNCASCHGMSGDGRGPDAARLDPPPVAFSDVARARERSIFGLYQVIEQGLDGTAMQSFADLPAADRWALAFYSGRFAFRDTTQGERIWQSDASVRRLVPDMPTLTATTPAALGAKIGQPEADAVMAYLRANPQAVTGAGVGSLALARERLEQSFTAYAAGKRQQAGELALSAYLDGFEPLEPLLASRDGALMARIETAMGAVRAAIQKGAPVAEVRHEISALDTLFTDAEQVLAPEQASSASAFVGALTILLREGLEALLVVIAIVAFLRKAERPEALRYVHAGWTAALAAGGLTWALATYAIGVSGASRELTEGFGSLLAAVILLSVGIWMHGKSQADQWQRYIHAKLSAALSKRSSWFLFGLAFLAVYREVFETILFYAALASQGSGGAILGGFLTGLVLLAAIAWAMLRYSQRLPIGKFFSYSSALMAVLAAVLAGKGTAALQEAGMLSVTPVINWPRVTLLGIYPTLQVILMQAAALVIIVLGFWYNRRAIGAGQPVATDIPSA
ncbi:cytochrome c/FTR1 family iron permease [Sphingopyxis sp. SE2]|jgi:high-affinity iron transporter|uniref:cytochrome c/FTR1 family iron permease n=1 Tax=unclassified Sphingopyxis TaxID=2614943 RepID=UPI0028C14BC8|nr:cytochrome c/FTR1 family iron permease [Sphingopyxis sp. SE2]MDT7529948.1 cytochrome c/FTR1 family iron permease [Sphingopyxis sp. SE2]